jgi:hypothetical protein
MITEAQKVLFEKYPTLFRQVGLPASESCMAWGIECGKGWYQIIDMLSEALINKYGDGIEYAQIKEKWGVLCVYVDFLDNSIEFMEARTLISEFEEMSSISCERCGKPASRRTIRGWYSTLCDEHFKETSELI